MNKFYESLNLTRQELIILMKFPAETYKGIELLTIEEKDSEYFWSLNSKGIIFYSKKGNGQESFFLTPIGIPYANYLRNINGKMDTLNKKLNKLKNALSDAITEDWTGLDKSGLKTISDLISNLKSDLAKAENLLLKSGLIEKEKKEETEDTYDEEVMDEYEDNPDRMQTLITMRKRRNRELGKEYEDSNGWIESIPEAVNWKQKMDGEYGDDSNELF